MKTYKYMTFIGITSSLLGERDSFRVYLYDKYSPLFSSQSWYYIRNKGTSEFEFVFDNILLQGTDFF